MGVRHVTTILIRQGFKVEKTMTANLEFVSLRQVLLV
jgi:hypothetical protein